MKRTYVLLWGLCALLTPFAQGQFKTIDAPSANQTFPDYIAPEGSGYILGNYYDSFNKDHGFLRNSAGIFTTIDPPGSASTQAFGISAAMTIVGTYLDSHGIYHGFVNERGKYSSFDDPNAGTATFTVDSVTVNPGTLGLNINQGGTIAGYYQGSNGVFHAYLRNAKTGAFTEVDAPGAGSGACSTLYTFPFCQGTQTAAASSLNAGGELAGDYVDSNFAYHCYVRANNTQGTITQFNPQDAGTGFNQGCMMASINSIGATTGDYADSSYGYHGWVRSAAGVITEFDVVPGTIASCDNGFCRGTYPESIDQSGTVVGYYVDQYYVAHGFVRATDGVITTFDVTGAGTEAVQGTFGLANNDQQQITGYYVDSSNLAHGFVGTP